MSSSSLQIVEQASRQILLVMLNISLKSLLIITCVYLLFSCTKKINAQTRHLVWFLSIAGCIILPVLSLLINPIKFGIFHLPENPGRVYQAFTSIVSIDLRTAGSIPMVKPIPHQAVQEIQSVSSTLRWTLGLIAWLAGAVAVFSRSVFGKVKAGKIVRSSVIVQQKELVSLLGDLQVNNDVNIFIRLYSSTQAVSPFTMGLFKPIIVLPSDMFAWPVEDIKPVLLHEIHHIKRRDYLTQTAATLICTVFWFVPVVWIALKKLYAEQENACDAGVIRNGINPRHYVKQMLRIACSMLDTTAVPGLFMVNGRRKLFESRIINILEKRGNIMKKKTFIFVGIVYLLVLLVIAGCATTTRKAVSEVDFFKTWNGTWVNTDIPGSQWVPQKIVVNPDGIRDYYLSATDSATPYHQRIALIDQWSDGEGSIWYTASVQILPDGIKGYEYGKISDSGNTLEYINRSQTDPIEKWEPDNNWYNYVILYRE